MKRVSNDEIAQAKARKAEADARAIKARERADRAARRARNAGRALDDSDRKRRDQAKYVLGGFLLTRFAKVSDDVRENWLSKSFAEIDPADRNLLLDVLGSALPRALLYPHPPSGWKPGKDSGE